jgi:hypothetical protein
MEKTILMRLLLIFHLIGKRKIPRESFVNIPFDCSLNVNGKIDVYVLETYWQWWVGILSKVPNWWLTYF